MNRRHNLITLRLPMSSTQVIIKGIKIGQNGQGAIAREKQENARERIDKQSKYHRITTHFFINSSKSSSHFFPPNLPVSPNQRRFYTILFTTRNPRIQQYYQRWKTIPSTTHSPACPPTPTSSQALPCKVNRFSNVLGLPSLLIGPKAAESKGTKQWSCKERPIPTPPKSMKRQGWQPKESANPSSDNFPARRSSRSIEKAQQGTKRNRFSSAADRVIPPPFILLTLLNRMDGKLKSTVLKLTKENIYVHFNSVRSYNKFGCQAIFKNEEQGSFYHVIYFSRPVLQVNTLHQHIQQMLQLYRSLNSKIVTPIIEIITVTDSIFIVSKGYEYTLDDLVKKREGLSDFQIAYFLVDLMELMNYLRNRDCLLEKIELEDLFLNEDQKITITFNLFLNQFNKKPIVKCLPFRNELRNRNNCPDLFFKEVLKLTDIDQINSWNMGVILYQLFYNKKPFNTSNEDIISQSKSCQCAKDLNKILSKEYFINFEEPEKYPELIQLLIELLKPIASERLKFSFIVIHPFLKKFPTPPHILPTTIFSCPPSENFKEQYFKKFLMEERKGQYRDNNRSNSIQGTYLRSQKQVHNHENEQFVQGFQRPEKQFRTQVELQSSERTLSENNAFIEQYVDISDSYGFGYQMNSGLVCFVFNDQTEYFYPSGNQREIRTRQRSRKGPEIVYYHDKLPEQQEIRKKIYILQAFQKTLKRSKSNFSEKERYITVSQYCRSKYSSMFLLSNDTVQVFFNDKMGFLLSKNNILVQLKNSDHFEEYDYSKEDRDLEVRRDYCLTVARKIFLWKNCPEQRILDTDGFIDLQS